MPWPLWVGEFLPRKVCTVSIAWVEVPVHMSRLPGLDGIVHQAFPVAHVCTKGLSNCVLHAADHLVEFAPIGLIEFAK